MSDSVLLEYELREDSCLTTSNILNNTNLNETKNSFTIEINKGGKKFKENIDLKTQNISNVTAKLALKYDIDTKFILNLIEEKINLKENRNSILKSNRKGENNFTSPIKKENLTKNIDKILNNANVRFDNKTQIHYGNSSNSFSPKKKAFSGKQVSLTAKIDLEAFSPIKPSKNFNLSQKFSKNSFKYFDSPTKDRSILTTNKNSTSSILFY